MVSKFSSYMKNTRAKKIYFAVTLVWALLGIINVLINFKQAMIMLNNSWLNLVLTLVGNLVSANISVAFYIGVMAFATYFIAAAMNKGFDIKKFLRLSVKSIVFVPLLAISDMIGFLIIGEKFTSFNKFVGVATYIPFYITVFFLFVYLAPSYVETSYKQRYILAAFAVISLIFTTFPY